MATSGVNHHRISSYNRKDVNVRKSMYIKPCIMGINCRNIFKIIIFFLRNTQLVEIIGLPMFQLLLKYLNFYNNKFNLFPEIEIRINEILLVITPSWRQNVNFVKICCKYVNYGYFWKILITMKIIKILKSFF